MITDLFALGSTIYEILTGAAPYEELESHRLERLYLEKEFPDVSDLACEVVIMKYWLCQFDSAQEVYDSIKFVGRSAMIRQKQYPPPQC